MLINHKVSSIILHKIAYTVKANYKTILMEMEGARFISMDIIQDIMENKSPLKICKNRKEKEI